MQSQNLILNWRTAKRVERIVVPANQSQTLFIIQGLGGATDRTLEIKLNARSELFVYGIIIGNSADKLNLNVNIAHTGKGAHSHVVLKGVLTDEACGIMNGTIIIQKSGMHADAYLEERFLLLSDKSYAKTIPNLEILADDVKAKHAATIGKVSADELFYLQSRGLSPAAATQLIVNGFIGSIIGRLPDQKVRVTLEAAISKKLAG